MIFFNIFLFSLTLLYTSCVVTADEYEHSYTQEEVLVFVKQWGRSHPIKPSESMEINLANMLHESRKQFCQNIKNNTIVTALTIQPTDQCIGVNDVVEALCQNSTLKTLIMKNVRIDVEGLSSLAKVFELNKSLVRVDLSHVIGDYCVLRRQWCQHLSKALVTNKTITTLNLARNCIDDENLVLDLGEVICSNSTLRSLDLSRNSITDEGALKFMDILTKNTTLQELDLDNNRINQWGLIRKMATLLIPTLKILKVGAST